ncbi:sigma-70 family RNA polymerase sigma factor [Pelagibius sp.]|uniref:sigma-70 family RNA polymerase sigma factor n=1 Tax=Pelagibius sp. TaxID=1931238 RepID=UPI003BB02CF5
MTRQPDSTALAVFTSHRAALVNYASSIVGERSLAEDVVQDAYLRLQRAERTRSSDEPLDEPLSYLFHIVRNLAIDVRRRLSRERGHAMPGGAATAGDIAEDRPGPEAQAIARDQLRVLQEALAELPDRSRLALEMHRFGGYRIVDIAAHLGVSVGTAHALVVDALDHCKQRLARRS